MKTFFTGRTGHPGMDVLNKSIYAHRGYHDKPKIPENSLPAFSIAAKRGWGVELDVHLTKDGKLVVFHDSELKRITGTEGILEEKTWEELSKLHLEGTQERIPLFDEVLEICEKRTPMIVELKTKGNRKALSEAVCRRLENYKGIFCIESFDPFAMCHIRKLNDRIVRGQLWEDFLKRENDEKLPYYQKFLMGKLLLNIFSKPDFIAYRFEDRENQALKKQFQKGIAEVVWTIRNKEDLRLCKVKGTVPIFEKFDPEENNTESINQN